MISETTKASGEQSGTKRREDTGAKLRRHPRFDCAIPAHFRIMVEEATFTPARISGSVCNISKGGMLIRTENLTKDLYLMMIRKQRFARVIMDLRGDLGSVTLFGKALWYDYQDRNGAITCYFGIAFEVLAQKESEILDSLLSLLEAEKE